MAYSGKKRIVFVGGGTGGHFYPLIAVAEVLQKNIQSGEDLGLYYAGPEPYNEAALSANNITFLRIPAGKQRRYFSLRNGIDPFITLYGLFVAIAKLYRLYPDVIFSKGGFTSVPIVLAAWLLRIPIMIHESDSQVGRANKLAAKLARYIGIAYDEVARSFPEGKTALVGIPIRQAFTTVPEHPLQTLGLPTDKPLLFVTGGSLGARTINNLILDSLNELLPHYTILHQTGPNNEAEVKTTAVELLSKTSDWLNSYYVRGTLTGEEMRLALHAASLIISRAGSTTIFEIAQTGKPSIIIPIPEKVSHDQRTNAYAYARVGAASVLEEGNLTDSLLTSEITRIMNEPDVYAAMSQAAKNFARPNAASVVANTLLEIANEHV